MSTSRLTGKLTDAQIRAESRKAQAAGKPWKVFDGQGLYVWCSATGACVWRYKFSHAGHEQTGVIGSYPEITIANARYAHEGARREIENGINPNAAKQAERAARQAATDTFESVAEQYIKRRMIGRAPRTIQKARGQLTRYVYPEIGSKPIKAVEDTHMLKILGNIESHGKIETAYKTRELLGRIFKYAKAQKLCSQNIVAELESEALPDRPTDNHHAAILERPKVGALLRSIETYSGQPATCAALRLLPHVFLRSSELRRATWAEIEWDAKQWRVPAERMKPVKGKRHEHIVPLSRQALAILCELETVTGSGEWLFPAIGPRRRPISENTLGAALATLGYSSDQQTPHGFRAIFRTIADEDLEIRPDWLELQLAHQIKDVNRKAYNRASFLPQRAKVMQRWSDHLDTLRAGNVVQLKARA
jgi:integrase